MFIINTPDGQINVDDPEMRQLCYNEMMSNISFNLWTCCPNCNKHQVYGNGMDCKELACPDCGLQYNPNNYEEE